MRAAYAMGAPWAPWMKFASWCAGDRKRDLEDWISMMTGRQSQHGTQPFGGWGFFGPPPPFNPPWFGGGHGWRTQKARRGDVRSAILAVLAANPRNGYQIIQEIAERSGGVWKPSPGSIYPTLQQLEDEGLVRAEEESGRRVFTLTEEGRTYVSEHPDELSAPWQGFADLGEGDDGFKPLIGQVATAVWQIVATGTPEQQAKGREALTELRRKLYAILAEEETEA